MLLRFDWNHWTWNIQNKKKITQGFDCIKKLGMRGDLSNHIHTELSVWDFTRQYGSKQGQLCHTTTKSSASVKWNCENLWQSTRNGNQTNFSAKDLTWGNNFALKSITNAAETNTLSTTCTIPKHYWHHDNNNNESNSVNLVSCFKILSVGSRVCDGANHSPDWYTIIFNSD